MTAFTNAVTTCFRKYVTFSGRARRPEYWWFALFVLLASILFSILDGVFFGKGTETGIGSQPISTLFSLLIFLPVMAAGWRRLHDTGRPGWYLLLPMGTALFITLGLVLGILAFGASVNSAGDPGSPDASVAILGLGGLFFALVVQLVLGILMIWWLSRPTQEEENRYGPVPPPYA